ncbi:MAG: heavy metal transporter [Sulfuricurvum sp. MLSB]|uniref:heavy-metal-associated domain-containing protein n=1 Tax=unclassified Sulfuricurvum TaxID=2632390 RepID=UPI0004FF72D7|nr:MULTISPECIES: heavy metal transporter [unclassified Sulfuricurvum]KFN38757.1 MAG: heavy metal transporter [Sulfuricurvum sp. MLSB]
MEQTFEVLNVKCEGCANTLVKRLAAEFGEVKVDLECEPRKITLTIKDDRIEHLKLILRDLGYPLITDQLGTLQTLTTNAKSFVSCAIGKMDR